MMALSAIAARHIIIFIIAEAGTGRQFSARLSRTRVADAGIVAFMPRAGRCRSASTIGRNINNASRERRPLFAVGAGMARHLFRRRLALAWSNICRRATRDHLRPFQNTRHFIKRRPAGFDGGGLWSEGAAACARSSQFSPPSSKARRAWRSSTLRVYDWRRMRRGASTDLAAVAAGRCRRIGTRDSHGPPFGRAPALPPLWHGARLGGFISPSRGRQYALMTFRRSY